MKIKLFILTSFVTVMSGAAMAFELDWSGGYRLEYVDVDKTTLQGGEGAKSYLLTHLDLAPKIIAVDGVTITTRIEMLPSLQYPDSQAGQTFGIGSNRANPASSGGNSNVASNSEDSSPIRVREMYLQIAQEYGNFVAGRFPLQFGLGMTYSAGHGQFDHWSTISDLVGYKFIVGNFSVFAMIGKPYQYSPSQGREVTDLMGMADYNNPETDSQLSVFFKKRESSDQSNDAGNRFPPDGGTSTVTNRWSTQDINVFLARGFEHFRFRMEAGFKSGSTGITNAANDEIKENGYGGAIEMDFPNSSKWLWSLRTGIASGDNPTTSNYEGFTFNRNYEVAFLLFNHPLGSYDVLRTRVQRNRDVNNPKNTYVNMEAIDEETVSNAIYLSPRYEYHMSDRWSLLQSLTYAQTTVNPSTDAKNTSVGNDLGYELDTGFTYKPHERITWINTLGLFSPGTAFQEGYVNRSNDFTYGFESKIGIQF